MNNQERLEHAKRNMRLYFPVIGNLPQVQRAALHVVHQCADKAEEAGDEEEAARLYWYLYTECQSLFHFYDPFSPLSQLPDYRDPPTDVSKWVTPDMFLVAQIATLGTPPVASTKALYMALPHRHSASIVGDLEEEYFTVIAPQFGVHFASRWYRRQILYSIAEFWLARPLKAMWERLEQVAVLLISRMFG
jgi:hypothetical protein